MLEELSENEPEPEVVQYNPPELRKLLLTGMLIESAHTPKELLINKTGCGMMDINNVSEIDGQTPASELKTILTEFLAVSFAEGT